MPVLDAPTSLSLRSASATDGWRWVRSGLTACMRRPGAFGGLTALAVLSLLIVSALPWIGTLLALAALPYLWLVFMRATRHTLNDHPFGLGLFAEVWDVPMDRRRALLHLCALYVLANVLVMLLADWVSPYSDAWVALRQAAPEARETLLMKRELWLDAAVRMSLMLPVTIAFWHAPALVHAVGLPPGKALFFSAAAFWHNRWALLAYSLGWGMVGTLAMAAAQTLGLLLGSPAAAVMMAMPVMLLVAASFYASLYFTTVESFQAKLGD